MAKIKIDIIKHHVEAIPVLAKIWQSNIGNVWDPNVQLDKIETWLQEWCNDSIPLAYIALDGDTPIGMCSLQYNDGIRPDLKPWLGDLCVDPPYQRQGVGKLLLEATQKTARDLGYDNLYLFAPDPTIPPYYSGLGWKKIDMDEYNGHPVTVMKIKL